MRNLLNRLTAQERLAIGWGGLMLALTVLIAVSGDFISQYKYILFVLVAIIFAVLLRLFRQQKIEFTEEKVQTLPETKRIFVWFSITAITAFALAVGLQLVWQYAGVIVLTILIAAAILYTLIKTFIK